LHEKQSWLQAPAQQTPSTQKPVAHSLLAVQAVPWARFTVQRLALQWKPAWQLLSIVQLDAQDPPMHMLGLHARVPPGTQVPWPLQRLAAVSIAPLQPPGAHSVCAG
jgi:hypothetical protein